MPHLYVTDDDGNEVAIPAIWVICEACRGEGRSSAHLGDVTEWLRWEDEETREDYVQGRYDEPCGECSGAGKIKVADEAHLTDAQRALWQDWLDYEAEGRHYQRLREMGIEW